MIQQRGFTLIEVLISMVILAIGLLGLAAMQALSLRDNQDAYYYQQATLLAYEMQDRIRGNSEANWTSATIGTGECTKTVPCDTQTMANNDYGYWETSVKAVLPAPATTTEMVKIEDSENQGGGCKNTYDTSLCLITTWGRTNSRVGRKKADGTVLTIDEVLLKDATFYLEVTP